MDVIYDLPPDLPTHHPPPLAARPARVLTTWPLGTFVENLLVRADGDFLISVHSENRIERVGADGDRQVFAHLPAPPTSLVESGEDLFVFGGAPGQSPGYLWRVDAEGRVETRAEVRGALFLNGSSPFLSGSVLVVDSLRGAIFRLSLETGGVDTWFSHESLTKATTFPLMPGGNGLRIFERHVYVSNTDRAILVRVPIQADGSAGEIETVAEHLRADDFVFDSGGFAYLTTHIENTLLRLSPAGERLTIAGPDQGMAGSTAVRFGRTPPTQRSLFVTTTGGLIAPYQRTPQPAKLVRIDVDAQAAPIDFFTIDSLEAS